jgi:hypothetical protein
MKEISIIGVDLAKNVFQLHGAAADGSVMFRKKLSRPQFQRFMAEHPQCLVVMEACGGAHHWARELVGVGHEVKLIAPRYVKPFIKRQKNDAADAEAIVEAALRPTMRYVEPKTSDQQSRSILFRTREQVVKQRTEAVNALRSHLYEFGFIAPEGIGYGRALRRVRASRTAIGGRVSSGSCQPPCGAITRSRVTSTRARKPGRMVSVGGTCYRSTMRWPASLIVSCTPSRMVQAKRSSSPTASSAPMASRVASPDARRVLAQW